jgi:hypothetical protein
MFMLQSAPATNVGSELWNSRAPTAVTPLAIPYTHAAG